MNAKFKIDWDAFVHALVTSIGAVICLYLTFNSAMDIRGTVEPLGSLLCNGPLTSLHRILPSITQGYAICDIVNGFEVGTKDAMAHGAATFAVMTLFIELGASHIIAPILIMECSTVILTLLRATFFGPKMQMATQAVFVISFFFWRIIVSPISLFHACWVMYTNDFSDCFPRRLFYITSAFSIFFMSLNLYWFIKIVKKVRRKLSGKEGMGDLDRK
mmetsp:Transcript_8608/g.10791  ORF Transcript_8608/g.10791 Transcript_8608/m.10791 type:complete len:217 (-) Transcript_8608:1768-2418(-)